MVLETIIMKINRSDDNRHLISLAEHNVKVPTFSIKYDDFLPFLGDSLGDDILSSDY
jgi:hypothetical protein